MSCNPSLKTFVATGLAVSAAASMLWLPHFPHQPGHSNHSGSTANTVAAGMTSMFLGHTQMKLQSEVVLC